jgi:hypothetical protein
MGYPALDLDSQTAVVIGATSASAWRWLKDWQSRAPTWSPAVAAGSWWKR